jgi:hypothetical protein
MGGRAVVRRDGGSHYARNARGWSCTAGATAHRRGGPHYELEIDVQRRARYFRLACGARDQATVRYGAHVVPYVRQALDPPVLLGGWWVSKVFVPSEISLFETRGRLNRDK